jgi:hypothetical protein
MSNYLRGAASSPILLAKWAGCQCYLYLQGRFLNKLACFEGKGGELVPKIIIDPLLNFHLFIPPNLVPSLFLIWHWQEAIIL